MAYLEVKESVGQRPIKGQKSKWFWKMFLLIMILKKFKIIIEYFCAFIFWETGMGIVSYSHTYLRMWSWMLLNIADSI